MDMAEEAAAEGKPPPAALLARPELSDLSAVAWDCFQDLKWERDSGFGSVGHIPWSAIDRWADRHGIDSADQFTRLKCLVTALDEKWLDHIRAATPTPPPGGTQ
jgi:hypothetical protein